VVAVAEDGSQQPLNQLSAASVYAANVNRKTDQVDALIAFVMKGSQNHYHGNINRKFRAEVADPVNPERLEPLVASRACPWARTR
jgi:hypothetical protein